MQNSSLIPLLKCLDVNFMDKSSINITALHETGHLIVMYAMDMMDYFASITIKEGTHTNEVTGVTERRKGNTDVTPNLFEKMSQFSKELLAIPLDAGLGITKSIRTSKMNGAAHYLPQLCRLYGGGAICRYYGVADEGLCAIDYSLADVLLNGLGLTGQREKMLPLVDMYLKSIFMSLDVLTKAIYKNLIAKGTLNNEEVMQIIAEWENFKFASFLQV